MVSEVQEVEATARRIRSYTSWCRNCALVRPRGVDYVARLPLRNARLLVTGAGQSTQNLHSAWYSNMGARHDEYTCLSRVSHHR